MDMVRFPKLMAQLYSVVCELEEMFGRHFTPDGHMSEAWARLWPLITTVYLSNRPRHAAVMP